MTVRALRWRPGHGAVDGVSVTGPSTDRTFVVCLIAVELLSVDDRRCRRGPCAG